MDTVCGIVWIWFQMHRLSCCAPPPFERVQRFTVIFLSFFFIKRHTICRWQVRQQQIAYDSNYTKTEKQEKHHESKVTRESYKQIAKANFKVVSKCELSRWQTNRQIEWHELRVTTQNLHSHNDQEKTVTEAIKNLWKNPHTVELTTPNGSKIISDNILAKARSPIYRLLQQGTFHYIGRHKKLWIST